jgi:hypothetical protein
MTCHIVIKIAKWPRIKSAGYNTFIFVPVFAAKIKSCVFPQLISNYPSGIFIREELRCAITPELIKTPNDVATRNYPTEECRR